MIKLYWIFSPNVIRVKAALEYKWLPYEHISVDLRNKSPEFLQLNPNWKIPTLVDEDGTVVYESINIVLYLDQKYPDTYRMISEDIYERIKQLHIVGIIDNIGATSHSMLLQRFAWVQPTQQQIEEIKPKIDFLSESIVKIYAWKDYVIWNFSFADGALLGMIFFGNKFMPELIHPKLKEWFDKLSQLPEINRIFPQ